MCKVETQMRSRCASRKDERTYVQRVCGEANLRHLHVERALVVAQSAYTWRETAGQSRFFTLVCLPSSQDEDLAW